MRYSIDIAKNELTDMSNVVSNILEKKYISNRERKVKTIDYVEEQGNLYSRIY